MTPLVLFFGAARRGEYESLQKAGFRLGLMRDTGSSFASHIPEGFQVMDEMPFANGVETLWQRVQGLPGVESVRCLVTPLEVHLEAGTEIAARLGLPGLSPKAVGLVRDKSRMRARLVAGVGACFTGGHTAVRSAEDALCFADSVGYPVVLKPASLYNSLYVSACRNEAELRVALATLSVAVPQQQGASSADALLHIEEYLIGSNHSVDCLVRDGAVWPTPVVDVVTGRDLGAADFHHFSRSVPSMLAVEDVQALQGLAVRVAKSIGMDRGAAHVEMILTPAGPRVVEVGGRLGGNRSRLLEMGFGIDLVRAYVDVLLGGSPALAPTWERPAAVVALYPVSSGKLRGFRGLSRLHDLPSVRRVERRAQSGARVGSPLSGGTSAAMVELEASDQATLQADILAIASMRPSLFDVDPDESPEVTDAAH